jgi:hypothetical protein
MHDKFYRAPVYLKVAEGKLALDTTGMLMLLLGKWFPARVRKNSACFFKLNSRFSHYIFFYPLFI